MHPLQELVILVTIVEIVKINKKVKDMNLN